MFYYDSTYVLVIIGAVICLWASNKVNRTFNKFARVRSQQRLMGREVAEQILRANQIYDVQVVRVAGNLTDHYDPRKRVLRLSESVYGVQSIAAVSVACHEAGHAIQHAENYSPLSIRNSIFPVVNFASRFCWILIIMGLIFSATNNYLGNMIFNIGVIFFVTVIAFHAITLPVEFNASSRAINQMEIQGVIVSEEKSGAKKVLSAAAMTYVASLAVAIANLLRILAMRGRD